MRPCWDVLEVRGWGVVGDEGGRDGGRDGGRAGGRDGDGVVVVWEDDERGRWVVRRGDDVSRFSSSFHHSILRTAFIIASCSRCIRRRSSSDITREEWVWYRVSSC